MGRLKVAEQSNNIAHFFLEFGLAIFYVSGAGNGARHNGEATMSNTETADTAAKVERKAAHAWLLPDGVETKAIASATGASYTDKATGESASYQIPGAVAGSVTTMLACFGLRTLMTNTASQARQARDRGEADVGGDVENIRERLAEIKDGAWGAERAGGGLGRGINIPALVDAIEEVATKKRKPFDRAVVLQRVTEDAKYRRDVKAIPEVLVAYTKRTSTGKSLDDVSFE
ncbi:MAG TPA: hypothetical protein VD713_05660 [Sphingomonadales bacterium]|nr:hypothetical protein [Sphingomonadales bacterium]